MSNFKVFDWRDAVTYGLAALLVTILSLVVQLNGLNDDAPAWRVGGMWGVTLGFWTGYGLILWWRYKIKKNIGESSNR